MDAITVLTTIPSVTTLVAQVIIGIQHFSESNEFARTAGRTKDALRKEELADKFLSEAYKQLILVQRFRFESWAKESGYVDPEGEAGLTITEGSSKASTLERERSKNVRERANCIVAQIAHILEELSKLCEKYKIVLEEGDKSPNSDSTTPAPQSNDLEQGLGQGPRPYLPTQISTYAAGNDAIARSVLARKNLEQNTSRTRKIQFYWSLTSQSSDGNKLQELIGRFKEFNDCLYELLPCRSQEDVDLISRTRAVFSSNDAEDLKVVEEALKDNDEGIYRDIRIGARMKHQRLALAAQDVDAGRNCFLSRVKPLQRSTIITSEERSTNKDTFLATFSPKGKDFAVQGTRVIVQWTCIPGTFTPEEIEILERRVQELTALLREPERPTSLPLPMCYGYLKEDPTDFALVYSLPAHADPLERPKSLYSLFPQNTESVKVPGQVRVLPDLAVRYRLARTLAEGLLVLHSIRWLHKAFNSGNILLFVGPSGLEVTKPMLSGFGLGRSASHEQQTIDLRGFKSKFALYQHPELRCETHRRYEARHDIYSLGMVLVEIAFWQNLHLFTKDGQDAEDFRQMIISLCHKSLGHRMGKRYCSVVLNCIDNDDCWTTAEANGDSSPASLDNFTWKVVKELGKCHCVI